MMGQSPHFTKKETKEASEDPETNATCPRSHRDSWWNRCHPPGPLTLQFYPPSFGLLLLTPHCREGGQAGVGGPLDDTFLSLLAPSVSSEYFLVTHLLPHPWPWSRWAGHSSPSLVLGAGRDEEALLFVECWFLGWPGRGQDWPVGAEPASWNSVRGCVTCEWALHTSLSPCPLRVGA